MSEIIRWKQRFQNFCNALKTIEVIVPRNPDLTDLEQDGLIQRFEYTFDLAWKVMQDYLKYTGYIDIKGPRPVIMQMAHDNIIDPFEWNELLTARNELSHNYSEELSRDFLGKIVSDYYPVFVNFKEIMTGKL